MDIIYLTLPVTDSRQNAFSFYYFEISHHFFSFIYLEQMVSLVPEGSSLKHVYFLNVMVKGSSFNIHLLPKMICFSCCVNLPFMTWPHNRKILWVDLMQLMKAI